MTEARQRHFDGADCTARNVALLKHADRPAAAREMDRGSERIVPGADDEGGAGENGLEGVAREGCWLDAGDGASPCFLAA